MSHNKYFISCRNELVWEKAIQPRVTVGVRSWQMLLVSDQLLIAV